MAQIKGLSAGIVGIIAEPAATSPAPVKAAGVPIATAGTSGIVSGPAKKNVAGSSAGYIASSSIDFKPVYDPVVKTSTAKSGYQDVGFMQQPGTSRPAVMAMPAAKDNTQTLIIAAAVVAVAVAAYFLFVK